MPVEITAADVSSAEEFLASVVAERVPEGRFTDGTALRDLVIKGLAVVAAQLRKENNTVQSLQSLLRIKDIARTGADADLDPSVADAADAILSNWFIYRKSGDYSRGLIQVTVNRKQDYVIARTTRFLYDRTLAFFPDSSADIVVPAASLSPVLNMSGVPVAYTFTMRVIAAKTGAAYNVFPATWAGTGGFSPYVIRVNNLTRFEGGQNRQGTLDMINQAETAISVRNLINDRSIQATLTSNFTYLSRMTNIGMGDVEMQRDEAFELATGVRVHVGGHFDTYLELAVSDTRFEGTVGALFTRPDGVINVFGDPGVADFTTLGIEVGDVIRVSAGLLGSQQDWTIREIFTNELHVSELRAFPEIATGLTYYIYRPLYGSDVQIYPAFSGSTTGFTTNTVQTANRVVLPAEPHYDIVDVAVVNPNPGDPYINAPDGYVHFSLRTNDAPVLPNVTTEPLPFRFIGRNPDNAQSSQCFDEIEIPAGYSGKRLRVTYQTLAGFATIDSYMRDRFQRVLCGNVQAKGYHPVYLSLTVPYQLSPLATTVVNELALRQRIVAFINAFDPRDVIDVSDIVKLVRETEPNIGAVFPFEISYDLLAPDGRIVSFNTADVVGIDPAKLDPLPNPQVTTDELLGLSVSNRTVRYLTRLERVFVEQR